MDVIITSAEPNNVTITCDKPNIIYVVGAQPVNVTISFNIPNQSASQSLKQTLLIGNATDGENIVVNDDDAVQLENGSLLKKGTYDFGANGGISRICGVGFEDMWQSGIRHVFDGNGFIRNSTNCFDIVPDANFDNTLRFKVDSLWTLDNGDTYKCTDASTEAAVWELVNTGTTPTLPEVLKAGDRESLIIDSDYTFIEANLGQYLVFSEGVTEAILNAGVFPLNAELVIYNSMTTDLTLTGDIDQILGDNVLKPNTLTYIKRVFDEVWVAKSIFAEATKESVGLGSVNNTSDIDKPVSTAQQIAIDNAIINLNWKKVVDLATTENITLSGVQTIDGVSSSSAFRILVKNQNFSSQNGIYYPQSGDWIRTEDAQGSNLERAVVYVKRGNQNINTIYGQQNVGTVVGTTPIIFNRLDNYIVSYTNDFEARNDYTFITNGTLTVTDSVPETNRGYIVYVVSGTTTIGGVGYTTGALVYRFFNGTVWTSTDMNSVAGIRHATATGTDTYTATVTGVTSYADADAYLIRFTNGNTTSATLNINSLGAIPLYRNNDGVLIGGDIISGAEMLCVYNSTTNRFQVIGTAPNSLFAYVTNADSVTLTKGMPVYAFGGTGDRMTVKRANNTGDATSAQTVGLVLSTSIAANQKGLIMMQGLLDGLSILPTATWSDGDAVYLGATPGTITNIKPHAPNHLVYLGVVTTASNGAAGRMYIRVQNGYELDELHNVQAQSPSLKDILWYDNTVSPAQWKTASIATILGYTPVTNARTLTINGTTYDLTADRSWTITTANKSINVVSVNINAGSVSSTDYVYLASGTINITLPTAIGNQNLYTIKNVGTGIITINTTSSQTIDGSLTAQIRVQFLSLTIISDGANWNII